MVRQVNHKELNILVKEYYKAKIPLIVYGRFGIGKSVAIKDTAKELSEKQGRKFVEWNRINEDEKHNILENPKDFFVFIDIRLSEYDSSDIKGLPEFNSGKKSIDFKVPIWALLMEQENSDGILFFDEISLAPPLVISSCYKILHDRIINNSRINKNWGILSATNTDEDNAYTHTLASPLKDRCGEVTLVGASADNWTEWALKNEINSRIIAFINFKSSYLWKVDFNDTQKYATYRAWERVNTLIKDISLNDYDTLQLISSSAICEGIATEFVAFCKISEQVDLKEIVKNPSKLKEIEDIGIRYFIISGIADMYREDKVNMDKIMEISRELDKLNHNEFVALLWRICRAYKESFRKEFLSKIDIKLAEKYATLMVAD